MTSTSSHLLLFLLILGVSAVRNQYEVAENVRPGTKVADLAQEFNLNMKTRPYLQITNRRSNLGAQSFAINRTTGILYVVTPPDRDTLCEFQLECTVEMTVAYGDRRNPSLNMVGVKITDVNDNAPTFPRSHMTLHVPEETDPFRLKRDLLAASDRDFGENGVQTYKLEGDAEQLAPFRLETRNDGPKLYLQIKLDRERRDRYAFRLLAIDGGRVRQTGTLSVTVIVDDINDQRPRFAKASYETTVDESVRKGTEILRVQAVDRDIGANGELVFRMASPSSLEEQMAARFFTVHTIDGEGRVAVKAHLDVDRTELGHFQFYVEARDKGASPQSAKVRVTVRVRDVNDYRPTIAVNYLNDDQDDRNGFVQEGPDRSFVAQVTVTDLDRGPGGQVDCRVGNDGFYLEELTHISSSSGGTGKREKTFKLMSRGNFDREQSRLLTFPLVCVDNGGGEGALTGSTMVDIRVTDRNDVTPTFIKPSFRFKLPENEPRGPKAIPVKVGRVTAVDGDEGDNAKITYSLLPIDDNSRHFKIDPGTGLIRAVQKFDREQVSHVNLKVQATDAGHPRPLSSTALVRVEIKDENDCKPVFIQSHYQFEIVENSRSLLIGKVQAKDNDEGPFAVIRYRLAGPRIDEDSRYFSVHPTTGLIHVNRQLDRETKARYVLHVLAIDNPSQGSGRHNTGTATVTVSVLDENDCAPRITEPRNNAVIELDEDATIGQRLFTMRAVDDDVGENASVSFSIVSGARGFFAIHEESGTFYVANKVQNSPQSTFVVHLRASDRGVPRPLNSSITVRIQTNRRTDSINRNHDPSDYEAMPVGADQRSIIIILATIFVLLLITTAVLAWLIKRRRDSERRRYYHQQAHKLGQNEGGKEASEANLTLLHSLAPAAGATVSKSVKYEMEINPAGQREARGKSGDHDEMGCGTGTVCRPKRSSEPDYYQSLAGTYDTRGKDGSDKGMHLYYEIHGADQHPYPGTMLKKEENDDSHKSKDYDTWNVQTKLSLSAKNTPAATRRLNQQYSPYVEASFV